MSLLDGEAPTKSYLARLNDWFRGTQITDEESGATSRSVASDRDFTDDELLAFLDCVLPHPEAWELHLRKNVRMPVPDESWVQFEVEFVLPAGEKTAIAVAHTLNDLELVEDPDTEAIRGAIIARTTPAASDSRLGWLLCADLESVECDDALTGSTVWVSAQVEGCGKPAVARHYVNPSGNRKYWIPMPDLLEPQEGWNYQRYCIAPLFAGDKSAQNFADLAVKETIGTKAGYVAVKRDLALAATLLVCAPKSEEWAKEAIRRHDGNHVWLPEEWFDGFCHRMGAWLKLRSATEYTFSLGVAESAAHERKFSVSVRAACAFLREREFPINGTLL